MESLQPELLALIASNVDTKSSLRSSCISLRDAVHSSTTGIRLDQSSSSRGRLSPPTSIPTSLLLQCPGITHLNLFGTQIVDLAPLSAFTRLTCLNLLRTDVADLAPLVALPMLQVCMHGTVYR